jgi:hypothetical protein
METKEIENVVSRGILDESEVSYLMMPHIERPGRKDLPRQTDDCRANMQSCKNMYKPGSTQTLDPRLAIWVSASRMTGYLRRVVEVERTICAIRNRKAKVSENY